MKIPESVKIGGIVYPVKFEDRLNNGTELCTGHIDYNFQQIQLDKNLQGEQGKEQTLLHEILHGIAHHFDLKVDDDEDTIDKLATGLYMVIVDNPDMFVQDVCIKKLSVELKAEDILRTFKEVLKKKNNLIARCP